MQPTNRFPTISAAEHDYLDAELRDESLLDDFELPPDYEQVVDAATAWVPVARDVRTASAQIAAIRAHLDALAAILDTLEDDQNRHRSHERVAVQTARVRALRAR